MKLPITVIGVIVLQIGGFIWWTAQQASTISNLEETVSILTVENNATDRTNLIRDVEQNKEKIAEMLNALSEMYEDMEDWDNELWDEVDMIHEDMGGMASHMMEIIKIQARVKTLEGTLQYLTRSPMHSDAR